MKTRKANGLDIARMVVRAKLRWQQPHYLIHGLTNRCNARCGFCAWNDFESKDQLTTEEIKKLYYDARESGFLGVSIWGGEPLLHRDSAEIFAYAKTLGLSTHLITNGALLPRKIDEVVSSIDRLCISVDHPSRKHDEMRGVKGLFEKIVEATREIRRQAPQQKIVYIYTLQKGNTGRAALEAMAELTRSLGVVGVYNALRLEVASTVEADLERYNPSSAELAEAFAVVRSLKERGYPVLNSYTHIDKMRHGPPVYRCHWPKFMLPIEANGDVVDCMHWGKKSIANVRDVPFAEILKHRRLRELAGEEGEACHKCVSLHRVEISEIWEGNFEPLTSWYGSLKMGGGHRFGPLLAPKSMEKAARPWH